MGTICAPSYANTFMKQFEKKFIYLFIKTFSLFYLRFIGKIFFMRTGSKADLEPKQWKRNKIRHLPLGHIQI